jgi:hypothetical protein
VTAGIGCAQRLNVRFIEYMPFDGNEWETSKMVPYREIKADIERRFGALQRCADPVTEVAKNYTLPGFEGRCACELRARRELLNLRLDRLSESMMMGVCAAVSRSSHP